MYKVSLGMNIVLGCIVGIALVMFYSVTMHQVFLAVPRQIATLPATVQQATTAIPGTANPAVTEIPTLQTTVTPSAKPRLGPQDVGTPPVDVIIDNTPLPVTFTLPVEITATQPISVFAIPVTPSDSEQIPGLIWLIAFSIGKLLVLIILDIVERNMFKKIYTLLYTICFILVDAVVLYPVYKHGTLLEAGGLWFVFWLVLIIIRETISFITDLTSRKE